MAKEKNKAAAEKGKVQLRRLDAEGGILEVDSMAKAKKILEVEKASGFKNYELIDGETDSGDDTGAVGETTEQG